MNLPENVIRFGPSSSLARLTEELGIAKGARARLTEELGIAKGARARLTEELGIAKGAKAPGLAQRLGIVKGSLPPLVRPNILPPLDTSELVKSLAEIDATAARRKAEQGAATLATRDAVVLANEQLGALRAAVVTLVEQAEERARLEAENMAKLVTLTTVLVSRTNVLVARTNLVVVLTLVLAGLTALLLIVR